MIGLALLLQIAAAADSVYATPALRDFVARAAVANRAPPPQLTGYTAALDSELAFILRDTLGRELTGQVEQLAATATWDRDGRYDVHVRGYRAQTLGSPYSALTFTRMYSVPTLYGNRLAIGMNDGLARSRSDSLARRARMARDSIEGRPAFRAVHPLATDRDDYYRFTGGDTVAVIHTGRRAIRLVRVYSNPIADPGANFTGFRGELDFDAERHHLVRMRGRFEFISSRREPLFARATGATGAVFVEFENAEVEGRYWLPNVQRSEFQVQMGLMGDTRPIYRVITRFRDHRLREDSTLAAGGDSVAQPLQPTRSTLTFAGGDSVSRYGGWTTRLGTLSGAVHADDFADLAPDEWRPTGPPRATLWPRRLEDVVRYNRVEGMFTGVSGSIAFRDMAPGLAARGSVGWAWSEGAARGGAAVSLSRGRWSSALRAERVLATTNDYLLTLETGLSLGPLFSGTDDHDYVDRSLVAWSATRVLKHIDRGLLTTELALVRDRHPAASVAKPVFGGAAFRANRNSLEGEYARATAILEWHPRVTGESLSPGLGARVKYELAQGELEWQRLDVRLAARQRWRGLALSARVDGGAVTGRVIPPQALYEMGGAADLPSYDYKEFGGDRAVLGRALAAWYAPVLRTPVRIGGLVLPGLSPGLGVGAQAGWAEASSAAARAALFTLGGDGVTPLSRPTGRVRSTVDLRVTVLSGAIGFGVARPVDQAGEWRPFFLWGAAF